MSGSSTVTTSYPTNTESSTVVNNGGYVLTGSISTVGVINSIPDTVLQLFDTVFLFKTHTYEHVMEWLVDECQHEYSLSPPFYVYSSRFISVFFKESKGAIEFKLRFM